MTSYALTIQEATRLLAAREASSVELTQAVLARIEEVEPRVKAFVTVTPEKALEQAREADRRIGSGQATPLTGVPVLLKDNLCTVGIPTTCSSRMLEGFVPLTTPRSPSASSARGPSWWAREIWTSSLWAPPTRTPPSLTP